MNAVTAVSLLAELLKQALAISTLVKAAQAENRDISEAELRAISERADVARAHLVLAIDAAKAKGQ